MERVWYYPALNVTLCCTAPIITQYCGTTPFVVLSSGVGTKCDKTLVVVPNVIPWCMTAFEVPNVIIMFDRNLITASNAFPDCVFINSLCAHPLFEISTNRKWHNRSRPSNVRDDSLEQSCLSVGNSRRTLCQQLTIIY